MANHDSLSLTNASIADLKLALNSGAITSVELTTKYLHRLAKFDMRGPVLNAVPVLNPNVLQEAQDSDNYRIKSGNPRPLEGIPFTVKDSFRVQGLTVAAGSPAFADLIATDDALIVELLRKAGAIVLGKTNMPPMADGGSQRGLYGRAESPYNSVFSTTACASGSSNGSGTATTSSFGAFGVAGETVSSGRAPASNNALVGYSPSPGMIPLRGQWPLYPTCDVVVPHAKSMSDLLEILDAVVMDDPDTRGLDFWRDQKHVHIPLASQVRPLTFNSLKNPDALRGKRIAVPNCFLGVQGIKSASVCSESVQGLFRRAEEDLQKLGAVVLKTDFPVYEQYTTQDFPGQGTNVPGMSRDWAATERCQLIASGWNAFLLDLGDSIIPDLLHVDATKIHPLVAPLDDPATHSEVQNQVRYDAMIESVKDCQGPLSLLPGCAAALQSLEAMRKELFEDWMDQKGYDLLVFPTNGDVSFADADENLESMVHALQDGVKYSNGGRVLKHLGIPCITVPMGVIDDKKMPVGITFVTKSWADKELLSYAFAFEKATKYRTHPPAAPALPTDDISIDRGSSAPLQESEPGLRVKIESVEIESMEDSVTNSIRHIAVMGKIDTTKSLAGLSAEVYIDGEPNGGFPLSQDGLWFFRGSISRPIRHEKFPTLCKLPRDQTLFLICIKSPDGQVRTADFTLI